MDIIKEGKLKITKIAEQNPFLEEIDAIQLTLQNKIKVLTPDELSRACLKLAVLLCNLGDLVAELIARSNELYIYRKFAYCIEFNKNKANFSDKLSENKAIEKLQEEYKNEQVEKYVADFYKTYYDDISRVISVIQSRLGVLKQEKIQSNYQ